MDGNDAACGRNGFRWFELATRASRLEREFYRTLMDAEADEPDDASGYTVLARDGHPLAALVPMEADWPEDLVSHWMAFVEVDDLDARCRRAVELGGRVRVAPGDHGVGRCAVVSDPTGGTVALFRPRRGADLAPEEPAAGSFAWCELVTADTPRAAEFYAKLLDWRPEFRVAGASWYVELHAGRRPVASVFEALTEDPGRIAHWCPYLAVDAIEVALARAERLGATRLCRPMHLPGLGMYAGLRDPIGAHLALFEPDPPDPEELLAAIRG